MNRRVVAFAVAAAAVIAGSSAYGASVTFTTPHLGATSLPVPKFYANNVYTTNVAGNHQLQNGDTLTVVYSEEMQASTLCAGAPTQVGTFNSVTNFTVTINNGTGTNGDDVLSINSIPATDCTDGKFNFGTFDLGASGYVTANGTFTASSAALTQTSTSATLVITLGGRTGSVWQTVNSGVPAAYTPNPVLTDPLGRSIASNTAATTATIQF